MLFNLQRVLKFYSKCVQGSPNLINHKM